MKLKTTYNDGVNAALARYKCADRIGTGLGTLGSYAAGKLLPTTGRLAANGLAGQMGVGLAGQGASALWQHVAHPAPPMPTIHPAGGF